MKTLRNSTENEKQEQIPMKNIPNQDLLLNADATVSKQLIANMYILRCRSAPILTEAPLEPKCIKSPTAPYFFIIVSWTVQHNTLCPLLCPADFGFQQFTVGFS